MNKCDFEFDKKMMQRVERKIVTKVNNNLKTKELDDSKMVKWIKNLIEEELACYSKK